MLRVLERNTYDRKPSGERRVGLLLIFPIFLYHIIFMIKTLDYHYALCLSDFSVELRIDNNKTKEI